MKSIKNKKYEEKNSTTEKKRATYPQQTTGIDPQASGQQFNLGNFEKQYGRIFFLSPWWQFVPILVFLLLFVVPATVQVWVQDLAGHKVPPLGPRLIITGVFLLLVLLIVYALAPLARDIFKEFRTGEPIAWLYDQGFILLTSKGNVQMVAHWTNLDVWHDIESKDNNIFHVYDRTTGVPMKLPFGAEFTRVVEVAVATCQYPSVQAAYLSDYPVNFGRLSVSVQGLYDTANSSMLVAWSNVESIKINKAGLVRIKQREQKGDWASFQLGQLVNAAALCRLLKADAPRSFAFQNQAGIA